MWFSSVSAHVLMCTVCPESLFQRCGEDARLSVVPDTSVTLARDSLCSAGSAAASGTRIFGPWSRPSSGAPGLVLLSTPTSPSWRRQALVWLRPGFQSTRHEPLSYGAESDCHRGRGLSAELLSHPPLSPVSPQPGDESPGNATVRKPGGSDCQSFHCQRIRKFTPRIQIRTGHVSAS